MVLLSYPATFSMTHLIFLIVFIYCHWRLITLQYCGVFCHTLTWISHGGTRFPNPPSTSLPIASLWVVPVHCLPGFSWRHQSMGDLLVSQGFRMKLVLSRGPRIVEEPLVVMEGAVKWELITWVGIVCPISREYPHGAPFPRDQWPETGPEGSVLLRTEWKKCLFPTTRRHFRQFKLVLCFTWVNTM